jgi:uncharacterized membrane protein
MATAGRSDSPAPARGPSGDFAKREAKTPPSALPQHVEDTVSSIEQLQAEHRVAASPQQRAVAGLTGLISRPVVAFVLATAIAIWIVANVAAAALGRAPLDPAPFPWLQGAATLVSLFLVVLVLGAQRHDDEVNTRREMLSLELAVLSEQKSAKIIQMLEEFRRDHPQMLDRVDQQADAMARPTDPRSVLDAIKETQNRGVKPEPDLDRRS